MSPELAAAADEAVERVHETVPKALETGPAPRPGSHYDRRTWRPVVAVATAAAAVAGREEARLAALGARLQAVYFVASGERREASCHLVGLLPL